MIIRIGSIIAALTISFAAISHAMEAAPPTQEAQEYCYPGLACPDGNRPPANNRPTEQWQERATGEQFFYVGRVRPPDPWLALRSEPTAKRGRRIMKMPQGTLLRQLERRGFWWRVQLTTGEIGWAHSKWIKCCKTVSR